MTVLPFEVINLAGIRPASSALHARAGQGCVGTRGLFDLIEAIQNFELQDSTRARGSAKWRRSKKSVNPSQ